jgi:translation initiation factor 1
LSKVKKEFNHLVFSTESGRHCPICERPAAQCRCEKAQTANTGDGVIRIGRETKGRGGKAVTTISGIPLTGNELKALAKVLKQICGSGGAVKDQIIEIQGDQREKCKEALEKKGYSVKFSEG